MPRRRDHGRADTDKVGRPNTTWVRFAVESRKGRRLKIAIYARYSTDEQNPRSVDAQVAYCRRFLTDLGVTDAVIAVISDHGVSGEWVSRPGINQVWEGVRSRHWDLIISEDASRLYRHETVCGELIETAVDYGIRVICANDFLDTADEDQWEDRLHEALRHHARCNRFTSRRIKRAHDDLWEIGAAIGLLKPGYRRRATYPATKREPEKGPHYDFIDPQWAPVIEEAYRRTVAGELPRQVALWLTEKGLPKCSNAHSEIWNAKNVIALIQRTDHRGLERWRRTISKKVYRTGKRKARRNDAREVLTRESPHLRIVPDWLWQKANAAIAARNRGRNQRSGDDHPLAGVARDSRGPLSRVFVCGRCPGETPGKMHVNARGGKGYVCCNVGKGTCWNKASSKVDSTHLAISQAIVGKLQSLDGEIGELVDHVSCIFGDDGKREARRTQLEAERQLKIEALAKLGDAIEKSQGSLDFLVSRSEERQEELDRIEAELDGLRQQHTALAPPSRKDIERRIEELMSQLKRMDRTVRDELECLVGRIRAVPYQQFGGDKVVLRAEFELRLWALLPVRTRASLMGACDATIADEFGSIEMRVDLFDISTGPEFGPRALKLKETQGLGLTAIGKSLGISKRRANIAVQYGESLRAAGLSDPFIELTEPPKAASRWRTHPRHQQERPRPNGRLES